MGFGFFQGGLIDKNDLHGIGMGQIQICVLTYEQNASSYEHRWNGRSTYVERLMNICSLALEHMFIGS